MSLKPNRKTIESLEFLEMEFYFEPDAKLFQNVNFVFPLNETICLTSAELGQGGSTVMQLLAGLMPTTSGKFLINGEDVNEMSFEQFLPYRINIGYSFDLGGLLHNRTLLDNIMLPLLYHKVFPFEEAKRRALDAMKKLGIERHRNQKPSAVQGSVRKMTCMIRPLLMEPELLLLDDPSVGLDPESTSAYWELIHEQQKQGTLKTIYVCTRDERLLAHHGQRRIEIINHQLVDLQGRPLQNVVGL